MQCEEEFFGKRGSGSSADKFALLTISPLHVCLFLLPLDREGITSLLRCSEERTQVGPVEVGRGPVLHFPPRFLVPIQVFFFLLVCLSTVSIYLSNLLSFDRQIDCGRSTIA